MTNKHKKLAEIEQQYNTVMAFFADDVEKRDLELSLLMTFMEREYDIPIQHDNDFNTRNKETIELYCKISDSRSL